VENKERIGKTPPWTIVSMGTTVIKCHREGPIGPEALGKLKNPVRRMIEVTILTHSDINQYTAMNSANQIGEEGRI
jgi:hypothetical protein